MLQNQQINIQTLYDRLKKGQNKSPKIRTKEFGNLEKFFIDFDIPGENINFKSSRVLKFHRNFCRRFQNPAFKLTKGQLKTN